MTLMEWLLIAILIVNILSLYISYDNNNEQFPHALGGIGQKLDETNELLVGINAYVSSIDRKRGK